MSNALIIFTKVPFKENVKTRLQPFLNINQSELLQFAMLKDCFDFAIQSDYDKIFFSYTPDNSRKVLMEKLSLQNYSNDKIGFFSQEGSSFGERFHYSIQKAFQYDDIENLAIIGSDCPFIIPHIHNQLIRNFTDPKNLTLGWSRDGGVYIVGISRFYSKNFNFQNLFSSGIESWLLIDEAKQANMKIKDLPELTDIDTVDDLRHAYILCTSLKKAGLIYPKNTDQVFNKFKMTVIDKEDNRSRILQID